MSEKPTPWSEVISGLLAVLTAIATYLGTQPLTTIFAVLLGAGITYTIQKRLQRESEKRSRNAEYVEKYYGPLLVEIQKIQETVLAAVSWLYDFSNLDSFKMRPEFYTTGKKFRADYLDFSDEIKKLVEKIRFYRGRIIDLICEKGDAYLVKEPRKAAAFNSDHNYSPINLRYSRESEQVTIPLYDSILQDQSPIDMISEKVTSFEEENLEVEFNLKYRDEGGSGANYDRRSYTERKMVLDKIVSEVKDKLTQDQAYGDFRKQLNYLRKETESISSRLSKYIGEYVSTVDI